MQGLREVRVQQEDNKTWSYYGQIEELQHHGTEKMQMLKHSVGHQKSLANHRNEGQ
jgi:hypothetical protein